jgi:hypothetical protein
VSTKAKTIKKKKPQWCKFVVAMPTPYRLRTGLLIEIARSSELHSFQWNEEDTILTVVLRTRDNYYTMDFNEMIEEFAGVVLSEDNV